jgi:hypothetical protein
MKKIIALFVMAVFALPVTSAEPAKKPTTVKKEVKEHKKFEGTKVPEKVIKKK